MIKEPLVCALGIMAFQAFDRFVSGRRDRPYLAKDRDSANNGVLVTVTPKDAFLQATPG
jgi:hypothetical protein